MESGNEEAPLIERLGGRAGMELLLRNFYASLREHPVLGPIFNEHVDDWPAHMKIVTDFWMLQTGGETDYRGGFAARHFPLNLKPEHFPMWLEQWRKSCSLHYDTAESEALVEIAGRIAERLQTMIEGRPGRLQIGRVPKLNFRK